jgi:hypothetical protein
MRQVDFGERGFIREGLMLSTLQIKGVRVMVFNAPFNNISVIS